LTASTARPEERPSLAQPKRVLQKIVALKRQSVEQQVRALQDETDGIQSWIAELEASLRSMDEAGAGVDALRLAEEHGHVPRLIADLRTAHAALAGKHAELHSAREALKRVFHSEERLGAMSGKR
jgi:prefoldin subunit 5